MAISISSSIIACLKAFNEFIEEIQDPDKDEPEGMQVQTWQDELGRLRIWAANIGAHQTGQSSLDFRLRDSSHIRQQIIKLLDELPQRLQDVRDVIAEGEDEDVESLGGSSSEDEESQTEFQQIRKSVATIINCLFQMSILVRKPAQHDLLVGSRKADVTAFEPFDYSHVLDKFPKADKKLVSRLGHAITRRRQYLKYRERHAMKLRQRIDKVTNVSQGDEGTDVDEGRYLQQLVRGYESAASVCLIMPDVSEIVYSSHGIRTRDKEKLENDKIVLRDEDGLQTLFGKTEQEKDSLIRADICDKSKRK